MSVEVTKIKSSDFERVYPLLTEFKNTTGITREGWKVIFQENWKSSEDHFGYCLLDESKPVGILGMIFSSRRINGDKHKFCDLSAWYVKPDYRGHSIALLIPILGRKDLTITTFTASNRVIAVLRRLGFKDIESHIRIVPPIPLRPKNVHVTFDTQIISLKLRGEDLQIFQDHSCLSCTHIGIITPEGFSHVMVNKVFRKGIPLAHVDYTSDRAILINHVNLIAWNVMREMRCFGIEIGEHMVTKNIPGISLKIKRNHPILFRSSHLKPEAIDTVYSEIQLLGLYPT